MQVPVQWWHGDADHIIPFEHGIHVVDRLPDAELHVMHGESHLGGLGLAKEILGTLVEVGGVPPSNPDRRSSEQLEPDGPTA